MYKGIFGIALFAFTAVFAFIAIENNKLSRAIVQEQFGMQPPQAVAPTPVLPPQEVQQATQPNAKVDGNETNASIAQPPREKVAQSVVEKEDKWKKFDAEFAKKWKEF